MFWEQKDIRAGAAKNAADTQGGGQCNNLSSVKSNGGRLSLGHSPTIWLSNWKTICSLASRVKVVTDKGKGRPSLRPAWVDPRGASSDPRRHPYTTVRETQQGLQRNCLART